MPPSAAGEQCSPLQGLWERVALGARNQKAERVACPTILGLPITLCRGEQCSPADSLRLSLRCRGRNDNLPQSPNQDIALHRASATVPNVGCCASDCVAGRGVSACRGQDCRRCAAPYVCRLRRRASSARPYKGLWGKRSFRLSLPLPAKGCGTSTPFVFWRRVPNAAHSHNPCRGEHCSPAAEGGKHMEPRSGDR